MMAAVSQPPGSTKLFSIEANVTSGRFRCSFRLKARVTRRYSARAVERFGAPELRMKKSVCRASTFGRGSPPSLARDADAANHMSLPFVQSPGGQVDFRRLAFGAR